MTAFKDLTGKRFGRLLALNPTSERKNGKVVWRCRCDCGTTVEARSSSLLRGDTQSCGCLQSEIVTKLGQSRIGDKNPKFRDLAGLRFGKLLVISSTNERRSGCVVWVCHCDCGETVFVRSSNLLSGHTQSCDCLNAAIMRAHTGDKNSRWITDRSLVSGSRSGTGMERLSRKCFERDDFTCLFCGERGGKLHAHHLYNWASHHDKRLDLDNLVTLCKACHKQFHHLYGVKNNSPSQFYEWIGAI